MPPRPSTSNFAYSFGPGALTPAVKILIGANVVAFLVAAVVPEMTYTLGLRPADTIGALRLWQPLTYMFLHGGLSHLIFNMLSLWMFGVELERMWGTAFFTRYYLVCGVGAAFTTILLSFLPGSLGAGLYASLTIGASGAIYGILMAYALYFPNRNIYMYFLFPVPVKYFVMIVGAISLLSAAGGPGDGIAHATHLGGLLVGYLYLKGRRMRLGAEVQYRLNRWRIDRMRRRFDVHRGGKRDDRGPWVH
jgi:membrane associated rhomboid family serine protease